MKKLMLRAVGSIVVTSTVVGGAVGEEGII